MSAAYAQPGQPTARAMTTADATWTLGIAATGFAPATAVPYLVKLGIEQREEITPHFRRKGTLLCGKPGRHRRDQNVKHN